MLLKGVSGSIAAKNILAKNSQLKPGIARLKSKMKKALSEHTPFFAAIAGAILIALLALYFTGFADLPPGDAALAFNDARLLQGFPVER